MGLGYIKLGQPATTLSGGEAQRVKLSTYLSKRATGKTLFILDEPTTGLSFEDCNSLIKILHRLVDAGNSVVLIEHHLDVIKNADWIIDLGPGAGESGGKLIGEGSPENIAAINASFTGQYLNKESKIKPVARTLTTKKIKTQKPKKIENNSLFSFPKRDNDNISQPRPTRKRFRGRRRSKSII